MNEIVQFVRVRPRWTAFLAVYLLSGVVLAALFYFYLYTGLRSFTAERLCYSAAIINGGAGISTFIAGLRDEGLRYNYAQRALPTFIVMALAMGILGYVSIFTTT